MTMSDPEERTNDQVDDGTERVVTSSEIDESGKSFVPTGQGQCNHAYVGEPEMPGLFHPELPRSPESLHEGPGWGSGLGDSLNRLSADEHPMVDPQRFLSMDWETYHANLGGREKEIAKLGPDALLLWSIDQAFLTAFSVPWQNAPRYEKFKTELEDILKALVSPLMQAERYLSVPRCPVCGRPRIDQVKPPESDVAVAEVGPEAQDDLREGVPTRLGVDRDEDVGETAVRREIDRCAGYLCRAIPVAASFGRMIHVSEIARAIVGLDILLGDMCNQSSEKVDASCPLQGIPPGNKDAASSSANTPGRHKGTVWMESRNRISKESLEAYFPCRHPRAPFVDIHGMPYGQVDERLAPLFSACLQSAIGTMAGCQEGDNGMAVVLFVDRYDALDFLNCCYEVIRGGEIVVQCIDFEPECPDVPHVCIHFPSGLIPDLIEYVRHTAEDRLAEFEERQKQSASISADNPGSGETRE